MLSNREICKQMRQFTEVSNIRAGAAIIGDYLIILVAASVAIRLNNMAFTIAAIALIAGRQVALLNLTHAAAHYTLFSNKALNDRFGFMFSAPIFESVPVYRAPHLRHHLEIRRKAPGRNAYLNDDLGLARSSSLRRTWLVFIWPFLGLYGFQLWISSIRDLWNIKPVGRQVLFFWIAVVSAFLIERGTMYLLVYWFTPLLVLYPAFLIWGEISDHFMAEQDIRNQTGLFYLIFLKGHELYHGTHHLYPYIPYYRLRAASQYLERNGASIERSTGLRDFVRCVYRRSD